MRMILNFIYIIQHFVLNNNKNVGYFLLFYKDYKNIVIMILNKLNISRYHEELLQKYHTRLCFFIYSNMCLPIKDGDLDTTIPAYSNALILLTASPFPF
jgi:hypothetical protein